MRYVLDTNILRAVMLNEPKVMHRLGELRALDIGLPQPVLAEVAAGLARLPRSRRKAIMRQAFEAARREFPRSSWTDEVSEVFGEFKSVVQGLGRPVEDFDVAIAAHAFVEGAVLVTANVRHFAHFPGLELENWLEPH